MRNDVFRPAVMAMLALLLSVPAMAANRGVFIGTASYPRGDRWTSLPDTQFDANDTRNTMIRQGMVSEDDSSLLIGRNNKTKILMAVAEQASRTEPGDTLIIYNSSHGGPGGKICASDADITPRELAAVIGRGKAGTVVLVNDSCHSASFVLNLPGRNVVQINAAGADRVAYSSTARLPEMGHVNGVLTKYLNEGLQDGTADTNRDGQITTQEINEWIRLRARGERDIPGIHRYGNNISGQDLNTRGADVPLAVAGAGNKFLGKRLVPDVIAQKLEDAVANLAKDDLKAREVEYVIRRKDWLHLSLAGCVIVQSPVPGTKVEPNSVVRIEVAKLEVVPVPNVIDMKVAEASAAVEAAKLIPVRDRASPLYRLSNNVGHQYPYAGVGVVVGSHVNLWETWRDTVVIPYVEGKGQLTAEKLLASSGLTARIIVAQPPDKVTHPPFRWSGKVWGCNPAGGETVPKGSVVSLSIAPPDPVDVPYLLGMTEVEATNALAAVGLSLRHLPANSRWTAVKPNGIYGWSPQPQAYKGDVIDVGIEYPQVPNIVGKSPQEAEALCVAAKLTFSAEKKVIAAAVEFSKVAEQIPAAGTHAQRNDPVRGFVPTPVARINVKVMDRKEQQPVKGALIAIAGPRAESVAAASGELSFGGIPKGPCTITASSKGYVTKTLAVDIDPESIPVVALVLDLEYDETTPRDVLRVAVARADGKPGDDFDLGLQLAGQVDRSSIPASAKIGQVEWTIITPAGGRIPSTEQSSGEAGLSIAIKTKPDWPDGNFTLVALVHTEEHGLLSGESGFVLRPTRYIEASIAQPCYTGQWSLVEKIKDLPFKIGEDTDKVRLLGLGVFADPKYWQLAGRQIRFRPIKPGSQQPAFELAYLEDQAWCRGTVVVKLTALVTEIDWDKVHKQDMQDAVAFTIAVPESFEPPFKLDVQPADGVKIENRPRKTGKTYLLKGSVILNDLPVKAKAITVNLLDKTGAVAVALIEAPETCVCQDPPSKIRRIVAKFSNTRQLTAQLAAMKDDDKRAEAFARQALGETIELYEWIGQLKTCRHLSSRARNVFKRRAALMRKFPMGRDLSEQEEEALAREALSVARDAQALGPRDIKRGFMKGFLKQ